MNIINNNRLSIEQLSDQYLTNKPAANNTKKPDFSFQDILEAKSGQINNKEELKFSKHAASRLATRDINLDTNHIDRLKEGIEKASGKGIKDSLMILDSLAFIVNIPSKTVITAMDQTETKENIFTNIDGAVII